MKKYLFAIGMSALAFTACDNSPKFVVEGTISNAADSTLYLEADGLSGIETIDSVKLGSNGNFSFKGAPSDNPEFYHIRLGNNIISFCVDSTETIKIKADAKQMAGNYEIEGNNDVAEIKEIAAKAEIKETVAKAEVEQSQPTTTGTANIEYSSDQDLWQKILSAVQEKSAATYAQIKDAGCKIEGNTLTIYTGGGWKMNMIKNRLKIISQFCPSELEISLSDKSLQNDETLADIAELMGGGEEVALSE